ncbi:MAG: hypothetical protein ACYDCI_00015 [Candidatus Limnocylindrales bacterium]
MSRAYEPDDRRESKPIVHHEFATRAESAGRPGSPRSGYAGYSNSPLRGRHAGIAVDVPWSAADVLTTINVGDEHAIGASGAGGAVGPRETQNFCASAAAIGGSAIWPMSLACSTASWRSFLATSTDNHIVTFRRLGAAAGRPFGRCFSFGIGTSYAPFIGIVAVARDDRRSTHRRDPIGEWPARSRWRAAWRNDAALGNL